MRGGNGNTVHSRGFENEGDTQHKRERVAQLSKGRMDCEAQRMNSDKRHSQGVPGGPVVKNSPANKETWVRSLVWDSPTG